MERFYLGTHLPGWLGLSPLPLCVSRRRLSGRKTFRRARAGWMLDSGAFSELHTHGRWELPRRAYVAEARRYQQEIGSLEWVAPMDWMCEPQVLSRTGLPVRAHQCLSVANFLELRQLAPELPWFPVLQGWVPEDYQEHVEAYARCGVDLSREPLVGVGTICRRQHTTEAVGVLRDLAGLGLRLHGFGLKLQGLRAARECLVSADSMAWSFDARRLGHKRGANWCGSPAHKNCANCRLFAEHWYERVCGAVEA